MSDPVGAGLSRLRQGVAEPEVKKALPQSVSEDAETILEVQRFLDSPAWKKGKTVLRETYISRLQRCPITDDLQRFRLAEALNVLEFVEKHLIKAHSDAEVNLDQVIGKDFGRKRGFFRR